MSHILRTSTEHKTASLADEGNSAYCRAILHIASLAAHTTLNTYKPMEINIDRSPQHWCPSGARTRNFCSRERCLTARPQLKNCINSTISLGYFSILRVGLFPRKNRRLLLASCSMRHGKFSIVNKNKLNHSQCCIWEMLQNFRIYEMLLALTLNFWYWLFI